MNSKIKNQTDGNLRKNQNYKAFSISDMTDLRSIKAAIFALNSFEPEPLFIKGQYIYV
jgi:hypothetical protein